MMSPGALVPVTEYVTCRGPDWVVVTAGGGGGGAALVVAGGAGSEDAGAGGAGAWLLSTSVAPGLEAVHTFTCPDCQFTALSRLTATFSVTCQSYFVSAAAVSSQGALTTAAFSVQGPTLRTSVADAVLAAVDIDVVPTLETFAPLGAASTRGYRVAVTGVTPVTAPEPSAVSLTFLLAQPPTYVRVVVIEQQSSAQLLSSLVGLLGLMGVFGFAFGAMEVFVKQPRAGRRLGALTRACCRPCCSSGNALRSTGPRVLELEADPHVVTRSPVVRGRLVDGLCDDNADDLGGHAPPPAACAPTVTVPAHPFRAWSTASGRARLLSRTTADYSVHARLSALESELAAARDELGATQTELRAALSRLAHIEKMRGFTRPA